MLNEILLILEGALFGGLGYWLGARYQRQANERKDALQNSSVEQAVLYGPNKGNGLAWRLGKMGYQVHQFTAYHMRINGELDLYPINQRFHIISTGERGDYENPIAFVQGFFNK